MTINRARDPLGVNLSTITEDAETRQTVIGFTNVLTKESSRRTLDTAKNRIADISALQGEYGAVEVRLQIASEQLLTRRENFLAAASQIEDADIAEESANVTKNQILQQTATAILAQANQQPALALSLL